MLKKFLNAPLLSDARKDYDKAYHENVGAIKKFVGSDLFEKWVGKNGDSQELEFQALA